MSTIWSLNAANPIFLNLLMQTTDMVTENIGDLVYKLHLSKDIASNKISDENAILKAKIGHVFVLK